jgi:hypothetical protein
MLPLVTVTFRDFLFLGLFGYFSSTFSNSGMTGMDISECVALSRIENATNPGNPECHKAFGLLQPRMQQPCTIPLRRIHRVEIPAHFRLPNNRVRSPFLSDPSDSARADSGSGGPTCCDG